MISIFSPKKLILLFLFSFFLGFSQNIQLSTNAVASVITCDPGNESYSLFGHTAIRISDRKNNLDVVYNYGAFDFKTPNFVSKFAKGDLQYFAVANTFSDFISQYKYEKRTVFEQELHVSLASKQKLFDNLTNVLATSKNYYTYKFIDKNCTSMVVEMLNKTLGAKIICKNNTATLSYRSILFPYFDNFFFEQLGTSCIFGTKVDRQSDHIFLPLELHKCLELTKYKNKFLCFESKVLIYFEKKMPNSLWNNKYSFFIFIGLILIFNNKNIDNFYLLIMGLLGFFFASMHFYSNHQELFNNYNVLLFNPLLIAVLYFKHQKNKKWISYISILNIALLLAYIIFIFNKAHLMIVSPLIIANLVLLAKNIAIDSKTINR